MAGIVRVRAGDLRDQKRSEFPLTSSFGTPILVRNRLTAVRILALAAVSNGRLVKSRREALRKCLGEESEGQGRGNGKRPKI